LYVFALCTVFLEGCSWFLPVCNILVSEQERYWLEGRESTPQHSGK
jgi:hypothetical protein